MAGRTPRMGSTDLRPRYEIDEIDTFSEKCPKCDTGICVETIASNSFKDEEELIRVYKCPACDELIVRVFKARDKLMGIYSIYRTYPSKKLVSNFSEDILSVSQDFVTIYNEAEVAENTNLYNICGPGYRKALEFLIKDYIIKKDPDKESQIKKKLLGNCIKEDINEVRIKDTAQRAVWIGNDETHYERKWESKDVKDLKEFIMLTLYWIESEIQYNKMKEEMPD